MAIRMTGGLVLFGRLGNVDRHLAVGDFDLGVAGSKARRIGGDRLSANRTRGQGVARGRSGARAHEAAPGQAWGADQSDDIGGKFVGN